MPLLTKNNKPLIRAVLAVVLCLTSHNLLAQASTAPSNEQTEPSKDAFNPSSPMAWMNRLATTVATTSYEIAYVVTSQGRDMRPYLWRHAAPNNTSFAEQLSLLNGPGFEYIRINNKLSIFEPGYTPYSLSAEHIDGPIPQAFIRYPERLESGYDVLLMGRDRVLGRMTQQLRVVSKDKSRYGYYVWLDEQTGLLLKLNMYSLENELLKQIQVTQFNINSDVDDHFNSIQLSQLPPITTPNAELEKEFLWTVSYLPVGMTKVKQKLHRLSTTGQLAEYMMLSDGLVDVSVYVMNATDSIQEDLSITTDATSVVSISNGRIQVTVVGDVPTSTANKIADSIVLVSDAP
ncbi:MAG: MucB/RseB C-terminal domain-containing protein [Glaciecola sp.]